MPFTDCISEKKDAQVDNAKDLDVVLPMYNLVEYIIQKHPELYSNIPEMI